MEPQIRYVRTLDAVNIAYWVLGSGPKLVVPGTFPMGNLKAEWNVPEIRAWYEDLASRYTVVRYDPRGRGLSDHGLTDYSLAASLRDLPALVEAVGPPVIIYGAHDTGALAIAYAAERPRQVSHLILWCAYARGTDVLFTADDKAVARLMEQDWKLYARTRELAMGEHPDLDTARAWSTFHGESTTAEDFRAAWRELREYDVTELLPSVTSPTLVLHRHSFERVDVSSAKELAAGIPNARLALIDGKSGIPFREGWPNTAALIDDFVGVVRVATVPSADRISSGTAVILFADIVNSTALTERLGDLAFREKARDLDATLRTVIRDNSGTPIEGKLLGDGVLATFASAKQAIEAALGCGRAGDDAGLPLHLGLHAGDVIREDDPGGRSNVYGGAVNIAARISGLSAPGEVLVSDTVRSLARTSAGPSGEGFEDRGEQALKGVGEPVRVYRVVQEGAV